MKISPLSADLAQLAVDAVTVGVFENSAPEGRAADVDRASGGVLTRLLEAGEISTKVSESTLILAPHGLRATNLLVAGLGRREELDTAAAFRIAGAAARKLAGRARSQVAFALGSGWAPPLHEAAIAGAIVGCQGQDLYRAEKKTFVFDELLWAEADARTRHVGQTLGENVNFARRLVNEPPQTLYPESFARLAEGVASGARTVWRINGVGPCWPWPAAPPARRDW
jgi:leucyl aminopeptidase